MRARLGRAVLAIDMTATDILVEAPTSLGRSQVGCYHAVMLYSSNKAINKPDHPKIHRLVVQLWRNFGNIHTSMHIICLQYTTKGLHTFNTLLYKVKYIFQQLQLKLQ